MRHVKLLAVFALVLASLGVGMLLGAGLPGGLGPAARALPGAELGERLVPAGATALAASLPDATPMSFADIAESVNPAVVYVQVTEVGRRPHNPHGGPFGVPEDFREFFQNPRPRGDEDDEFRREGGGSGFIIDKDGWILTNNHVISGATKVNVKLADDREFVAEVRGTDELLDVALLKINPSDGLPVAQLGDSDRLRVGDWVMAIGNPFVYEHTVTVGVVSHKGRSSGNPFQQFIQTDAAINFGNSGGPLLNTLGDVVGINTAISAVGQGIGFAIPINRVRDIMAELKETGKVARGFLGVNPQELDEKLAKAFPGLPTRDGALVVEVEKDSPAAEAGMAVDDVIVEIGGKPVRNREDLFRIVGATSPGSQIAIKVLREEKKGSGKWGPKALSAKLVERPVAEVGAVPKEGAEPRKDEPGKKLGLKVEELTPEARKGLGVPERVRGVVVVDVSARGAAADAGISQGDIISEVNGDTIGSLDELALALDRVPAGSTARVRVFHQGAPRYVAVVVGK